MERTGTNCYHTGYSFACHKVPLYTGFSPFKLLYGRTCRDPLNMLESNANSNTSIVYYVLAMQERLKKMIELVQEECKKKTNTKELVLSVCKAMKVYSWGEVLAQ